jgi:TonB family protein|tara:strand:+ start:400 stop:729 length:330 start_codon:yes stop_codon:yes gene_type:complete
MKLLGCFVLLMLTGCVNTVTEKVLEPSDQLMPERQVLPKYPSAAFSQKISGFVTVSFNIAKSGQVVDLKVVSSEPTGVFEQAALEAVNQWLYPPQGTTTPQKLTLYFRH